MASTSKETVTVCCKLPHGLVLRVFRMEDTAEPISGGGFRTVKVAREYARHKVNGNAHPQDKAPLHMINGGYAFTTGVPKDLWDVWLEQNKDSMVVANNLIFAHVQEASARDETNEKTKITSGFERLDPTKMPRNLEQFQQ